MVRAEATAIRSASVRPAPRANTTVAGSTSGWSGACWSWTTRVEGAEAGRLAAAVPLITLDRLPASG